MTRAGMPQKSLRWAMFAIASCLLLPTLALADGPATIPVTLKNHRFLPAEIHVAAGKAVMLAIKNEDSTAEEFDSPALRVEKIIPGGKEAAVRLRPLAAGRYPFGGEFHGDTAVGMVVAE